MLKMIPHSVVMRKAGFVFNPRAKFMAPQWVQAVERLEDRMEKRRAFNIRVNKTVDVLSRFVATWVAQSREMRRMARIRAAGEKWRIAALSPNWANMMEEEEAVEEERRKAVQEAFEARLMAMSDRELVEYHQRTMADHRIHHEDYRPWMEFIAGIHRKRAALRVQLVDNAQMWVELNNQQRPAQVRRVIPRNRFGALDSSDSE